MIGQRLFHGQPSGKRCGRAVWALVALGVIAGCTAVCVQEPTLDQAALSKLDIHAHYTYPREYLIPLLDAWTMQAMVVEVVRAGVDPTREHWAAMRAHQAVQTKRLLLCASFDASRIDAPDFADRVIAQLREDLAQGARMVKVWKEIGMTIRDAQGVYIQIDDPRFQPIWDFLTQEGIPVLAHVGEPRAAWLPLDEESPHYTYYKNNPPYHAYHHPEMPRWEAVMQARDRWLANNPNLTVIGAHLGSMAYDVDEVARRLDLYPNFFVETAARFGDLARQPSDNVRDFFIQYQDRILYGTDLSTGRAASDLSDAERRRERNRMDQRFLMHWRYLTRADTLHVEDYGIWYSATTPGLDLPREVVEKFYYHNAARLLAF